MTRRWSDCSGDPCICPKPDPAVAENARRLAWFTDDELAAELERRRAPTTPTPSPALAVRAGTDDEESEQA